jgi:hypothetical protein
MKKALTPGLWQPRAGCAASPRAPFKGSSTGAIRILKNLETEYKKVLQARRKDGYLAEAAGSEAKAA